MDDVIELRPGRKLVDEVADWLFGGSGYSGQVRTDAAGVRSLAHLMVVVPTAQSGRRLRLALARRAGCGSGLLPPLIRMPMQVLGEDGDGVAGRADELVAFWEAEGGKSPLDAVTALSDIRAILGANALAFSDVAGKVGSLLQGDLADSEISRWEELAKTERAYYAALARRGLKDRIVAMQERLAAPERPQGVERVVIAGVLDPVPVMRRALAALALPVTELVPRFVGGRLRRSQIVPCGTAAGEAARVAATFGSVKPDEALPALCMADPEMFPELRGALQTKGVTLRNPSRMPLSSSSLGRLVAQLAALAHGGAYQVFSTFIRTGDVRRWLCASLRLSDAEFAAALVDLDNAQALYIPERIDDIAGKTHGKLRAIFELVQTQLRKHGVREMLESIFREHCLDERDPGAREFAAAAQAVGGLIDECFAPSVPEAVRSELFVRRIGEATYSLEQDEGESVVADGWLELPYLDADEVAIVGFCEGKVPESVVGHPYLPDSLRRGLGLPDNEARGERDRRILDLVLACRRTECVSVSFHSVDAAGDVMKPSRLLFETDDDNDLIDRVTAFYGLRAGTVESLAPDLPAAWKLRLPIPPEHEELVHCSPSRIDAYLRCPFTYYLARKDVLGDKRMDDRAEELPPYEYGHMAHEALESWGRSPVAESEKAEEIAAYLEERVEAWLAERFGAAVPAIVALQGESVKRRLRHFAAIQAAWHRDGWRIVKTEEKLAVVYGHTRFIGQCDRIDYRAATGEWCVIDYKTWDSADRSCGYDAKQRTWKSLQLPLYCAMLDVAQGDLSAARRDRISACYCVLGKTKDNVKFTPPMSGEFVPDAERFIRETLLPRMEAGIFWPPSPTDEWRYDYRDWLSPNPAESVDGAWIADQLRRLGQ